MHQHIAIYKVTDTILKKIVTQNKLKKNSIRTLTEKQYI